MLQQVAEKHQSENNPIDVSTQAGGRVCQVVRGIFSSCSKESTVTLTSVCVMCTFVLLLQANNGSCPSITLIERSVRRQQTLYM